VVNRHIALLRISRLLKELFGISSQKDPLTLAAGLRLYYESFVPLFAQQCHELFEVMRQNERRGEKVVVFRELFLHSHKVSAKHVLFR
jgi:hypothetical protein